MASTVTTAPSEASVVEDYLKRVRGLAPTITAASAQLPLLFYNATKFTMEGGRREVDE